MSIVTKYERSLVTTISSNISPLSYYITGCDPYKIKQKKMDTYVDSYGIELKVGQWVVCSNVLNIGKIISFTPKGNPRILLYSRNRAKLDKRPIVQIMKKFYGNSIVIIDKPKDALED